MKIMMECANGKKKSNRRKLDMGLDAVPRNVKRENPDREDWGKMEKKATWPH